MSSAILYLAIIAIWAGVLIPRWLRRDSARGHPEQDASNLPAAEAGTTDDFGPAPAFDDDLGGYADGITATSPDADAAFDADPGEADDTAAADAPFAPDQSRRRVLAARRRLLWMMLALEAAADVLAASGLAAWWVIAPPTVMLAGYLLLLREAAQADAERDARERDAAQAREQARNAREAARTQAFGHPPIPPAVFAAAPVPEDYQEDGRPGRDYTPGGRYTASGGASTEEDDAYDQYTQERLRAVGD
jgi:hypothetical protein